MSINALTKAEIDQSAFFFVPLMLLLLSPTCNKFRPIGQEMLKGFLGNTRSDKLTRQAESKWRQQKEENYRILNLADIVSERLCKSDFFFLSQHSLLCTNLFLSGSK